MKFRKKPIVIDAIRHLGASSWEEVFDFLYAKSNNDNIGHAMSPDGTLKIKTLEGEMTASVGSWIIRGINGELYPCKPDIFKKTYERVDEGE